MHFSRSLPEPRLKQTRTTILGLILAALATSAAAQPAQDKFFEVGLHQQTVVFPAKTLTVGSSLANPPLTTSATAEPIVVQQPLHGTLVWDDDDLIYTPAADFWSLGLDSFTYSLISSEEAPSSATVFLVATRHGELTGTETFENASIGPCWMTFGDLTIGPDGAISGSRGAQIGDLSGGFAQCQLPNDTNSIPQIKGNGQQGGGGGMTIRPPLDGDTTGPPPMNALSASPIIAPIFSGREFASGTSTVDIELKSEDDESSVRAVAHDTVGIDHFTAWYSLRGEASQLGIDWWPSSLGAEGGLILWVDGLNAGRLDGLTDFSQEVWWLTYGLAAESTSFGEAFEIDDLEVWQGVLSLGQQQVRLADGFEQGFATGWQGPRDSNLSLTQTAAISGYQGLQVDLLNHSGAVVTDLSPTDEDHYNIRFKYNADNLTTVSSGGLVLLSAAGGPTASPLYTLQLRSTTKGELLFATVWLDAGSTLASNTLGPLPIGPGTHTVEVQWRASSGPLALNGLLRIWIDGQSAGELTGLDNDTLGLDSVYFGAVDVDQGFVGEIFLDDFISWN